MRFILMIIDDEEAQARLPETEMRTVFARVEHIENKLKARHQLLDSRALKPSRDGKLVNVKNGQPRVTAGGLAIGAQAVGGYFLIECASEAEAIDWAKQFPVVGNSAVEVRPILEMN
jgi:hypothetical protein